MQATSIFQDRDGDVLSAIPRDTQGNDIPDPVITITRGRQSFSVVMNDDELDAVIRGLGDVFGYDVTKKPNFVEIGRSQSIMDLME